MTRAWLHGTLLTLLVVTAACRPDVSRLEHMEPSKTALASAVLGAVERNDRAALEALAVSEREFRDHVWPELPAARADRNLPLAYVWGELRRKSERGLAKTIANQTGRKYQLVDVRFGRGTTQYHSFVVHRESILTVIDDSGSKTEVRLFGSVLEKDGQFKVFSYVVD